MFLKRLEEYDNSTPGKNNKIKLTRIIVFIFIVVIGIVFSSLTEIESKTIRGSGGSTYSSSCFGSPKTQNTIKSKYQEGL